MIPVLKTSIISSSIIVMIFVLQSFGNETTSVANTISDFTLQNVDGKNISLKDYPDAKGFIIVFTCNSCPFAKLYTGRMNDLYEKYKSQDIPLLAINSLDTTLFANESFAAMKEHAKSAGFNFPYLHDPMQVILKDFKADRTPEAFIIWKENNRWKIEYSGAIDDNGAEPDKVTQHYVTNAIDELIAGKQVTTAETHSVGCSIFYRKE
jgi:glutathione peroxidase-family protein